MVYMKLMMFGTFLALLLLSGFVSMRQTRTVGDFVVGGRSIGPWMSAFAYGTTYFSAVIFVGYAGKLGWSHGISAVLDRCGQRNFGQFSGMEGYGQTDPPNVGTSACRDLAGITEPPL